MVHLGASSSAGSSKGRRPWFGRARDTGRLPVTSGGPELTDPERASVPHDLEAVAEALRGGQDPAPAAAESGRAYAADGSSLGESLAALRATYALMGLVEPTFAVTESMATAWSEATLTYLSDVSCEDPLTGLASAAHLRARLAEVYREAEVQGRSVRASHALLVADLGELVAPGGAPPDPFAHALTLAAVAEAVRSVFPGEETLARVGKDKIVTLVRRPADLGATVVDLRHLLADLGYPGVRIWLEALPGDAAMASQALAGLGLLGNRRDL